MAKKTTTNKTTDKKLRFETLEDRLVLSAQSVADVPDVSAQENNIPAQITGDDVAISQSALTLTEVNQSTGVNHVHENYGFDGEGQTVVVIDSGIAWDHYALGGGFGDGYRVVGGWDFAENDADPFDDGGAGYHGTHVSGIIGSDDAVHQGVASGVDLVSLRVFDDAGNGNLEWVEQALRWVEQNIDSFDNPITTVNLSIGTNWNANNLPEWATLEEEFAALESKGIFISVAAGNSFQLDPTIGVSYPAVSEHVVPVASHGEDGLLSDFSQRNQNVLVAPGESIISTVPGHLLGQSVSQSFIGSSGTSMAAPYVAGSSVLIRQAMGFMGYQDITQEQIYQNLSATADTIFDNITGANYKKINIQSAIEAIIADKYGDTADQATDIGILQGNEILKGTIGTFHDKDVIQFTAGQTGVMTFQFSETHDLDLVMESLGQSATVDGDTISIQVEAGKSYQLKLSTNSGIGHYSIQTSIETFVASATDLGVVSHFQDAQFQIDSASNYQLTASRNGILAIQMTPASGASQLSISVYDQNNQLVGEAQFDGQKYVFQRSVLQGESFTLKISGEGSGALDVQNLVSHQSGNLVVYGTDADNVISLEDGEQLRVVVDGVEYEFQRTEVTTVGIDAGQGEDKLTYQSTDGDNHTAWMRSDAFYASGSGYQLSAFKFQDVTFAGQQGDVVNLYGSAGVDQLYSDHQLTRLSGDSYSNVALGAGRVYVTGSVGDQAEIIGSNQSDYLYSAHDLTYLSRGDSVLAARGFTELDFDLKGGEDSAHLIGSWGDDTVVATYDSVSIESDGMERSYQGIEKRYIFGNGGNDSAIFHGSSHSDSLYAWHDSAYMQSGDVINYVRDFHSFTAYGDANDRATLFDSSGDDRFIASKDSINLSGEGFSNTANGFGSVDAYSSTGNDTAEFNFGDGVTFQDNGSMAAISGDGFYGIAHGFDSVQQNYQPQSQSETQSLGTLSLDVPPLQSDFVSGSAIEDQAESKQEENQITGVEEAGVESQGDTEQDHSAQDEVFADLGSQLGDVWTEVGQFDQEESDQELPTSTAQNELLAADWYFGQSGKRS